MLPRVQRRLEAFLRYGPLTIAAVYLVIGLLWIYFSDTFFYNISQGNSVFLTFSTFKGFGFILLTSLLLFTIMQVYANRMEEERTRYRTLADNSPDLIYHLSLPDGRFRYVSPAAKEVTGYSPGELITNPALIRDIVHPAWREEYRVRLRRLEAGEDLPPWEFQIIPPLGETRWVREHNTVLRDDKGRPVALEGEISDITERKLAVEILKNSERQLTDIIDFLPDATFAIDRTGKVIAWNRAMEQMTGVSASVMVGKGDHEYAIPIYGKRRPILIDMIFEDPSRLEDWYTNIRKEGDIIIGEAFVPSIFQGKGADLWGIAAPLYDPKGKITGAIESLRDFGDRRRAEEALNQTTKKLNLLNSIALDDLQNGVFSLAGYLSLARRLEMPEKIRTCLDKQERIVGGMSDSLKFTRHYQSLGLKPPRWQSVVHTFLFAISHLDISHLNRDIRVGELEIYADLLLENVFFTFAENVLLHAPAATSISLWSQEVPCGLILIFEDNGPGVPDDMKEKIFDRCYEKKKGLGLFLAREILSITDITLRETGDYGKGARFEMFIPRRAYRIPEKKES